MSVKGNCCDNAAMERFFGTLNDEKIGDETPRSLEEVKEAIVSWIAMEYNTRRPHSALGNISPCAFAENLAHLNRQSPYQQTELLDSDPLRTGNSADSLC